MTQLPEQMVEPLGSAHAQSREHNPDVRILLELVESVKGLECRHTAVSSWRLPCLDCEMPEEASPDCMLPSALVELLGQTKLEALQPSMSFVIQVLPGVQ